MSHAQNPVDGYSEVNVPTFVTVTDVTPAGARVAEYVLCNEATGRFFLANRETVAFFTALKDTRQIAAALDQSGMSAQQAGPLLKRLYDFGLITNPGETHRADAAPTAPLENKLVTIRWDMFDIQRVTRALRGIGRFAYSPLGYGLWALLMLGMAFELLSNRDKVVLTMAQVLEASWQQWAIFAGFFIALKVVHELGHALAYRQMCLQESIDPGPIRVGICVFALTPFPFTDVTGAWRLKSTGRRVLIGAGGIYFETWAMAALTFVWAETQTGLLQTVILQVVIVAGALALLFNLNPAIKLDGYFILTDYLRKPNLAGRAALAARTTMARLLGAEIPRPPGSELAYWILSYLYRWTIFAGIFWIFYQIDPRLAPVAIVVVIMTLIIRPLITTAKFARTAGAKPSRVILATGVLGCTILALFIPLPDRMLIPGQFMRFDTRFVEATETAMLQRNGEIWLMENPQLDHRIENARLQGEMLENLKRASFASAQEQARLTAEIDANTDAATEYRARLARLTLFDPTSQTSNIWTPLEARWLGGSWVRPSPDQRLGAISVPTEPYLMFRMEQRRLRQDLNLSDATRLRVRPVIRPTCVFPAQLTAAENNSVARNGAIQLRAAMGKEPGDCAGSLEHGAALVGRIDLSPTTLFARAWLAIARALQDRLPIEQQ